MRRIPIVVLFGLAGCASGGAVGTVSTPGRVLQTGETYDVRAGNSSDASTLAVAAAPDVAWQALTGVYAALEIPIENVDPAQKVMGNARHAVRRRLAGEPLSIFLNCGSNMSGSIANSYEVRLSVLSQILPAEVGRAGIRTRVDATARSREGTSGSEVVCGSTGQLEKRIAELLNRSIGG